MTIIKSLKQKSMHLIGVDFFFVIIFKGIKIFFFAMNEIREQHVLEYADF